MAGRREGKGDRVEFARLVAREIGSRAFYRTLFNARHFNERGRAADEIMRGIISRKGGSSFVDVAQLAHV